MVAAFLPAEGAGATGPEPRPTMPREPQAWRPSPAGGERRVAPPRSKVKFINDPATPSFTAAKWILIRFLMFALRELDKEVHIHHRWPLSASLEAIIQN